MGGGRGKTVHKLYASEVQGTHANYAGAETSRTVVQHVPRATMNGAGDASWQCHHAVMNKYTLKCWTTIYLKDKRMLQKLQMPNRYQNIFNWKSLNVNRNHVRTKSKIYRFRVYTRSNPLFLSIYILNNGKNKREFLNLEIYPKQKFIILKKVNW